MDDTHRKTIRQVLTFPQVFASTGGFMTVILLIAAIIIERFHKTIYYSTLIKSFYRFKEENE